MQIGNELTKLYLEFLLHCAALDIDASVFIQYRVDVMCLCNSD